MNNGYYGAHYSPNHIQNMDQGGGADGMMGIMGPDGMPPPAMMSGQSLDDIVNQNTKDMRRRSLPYNFHGNNAAGVEPNPRRLSMLDFADSTGSPLDGFQFDNPSASGIDGFMGGSTGIQGANDGADRTNSSVPLALNTQFANQNFTSMGPPGSAYASPMHPSAGMDMDVASPYLQSGLPMNVDMVDPNISMMGNETHGLPYYGPVQQQFGSGAVNSPINQNFSGQPQNAPPKMRRESTTGSQQQAASEPLSTTPDVLSSRGASSAQSTHSGSRHPSVPNQQIPNPTAHVSFGPDPPQQMPVSHDPSNNIKVPWATPAGSF